MTTAITTQPQFRRWYQRPEAIPTDFIGTKKFVERLAIFHKEEGVNLPSGGPCTSATYMATPAYFIFVMTPHGDMRLEVSKQVFELLKVGDEVIVRYRHGRWTGALKGVIAN